MAPTIKAEFRKLFTIRSTYILIGLSLILIAAFSFYFEGYRGNTGSAASKVTPLALQEIISNGVGLGVLFATIIAILFIAHEYRYNTITYTLTANARRTRVLLAKVLTIVLFSIGCGLVAVLVAVGGYLAGLALRDATLPAQNLDVLSQVGRVAFYYTGYALVGLLIATVARSVVVAIATLLIFPTTIEPLLGLILKENTKYLPFSALDSTVGAAIMEKTLSPGNAMIVTSVYLVVGLLVTWLLFVRRDAS